ncbi:MAG: hypothetical protein ACPGYV_05820 [Phycisphaeraceae bacterium]
MRRRPDPSGTSETDPQQAIGLDIDRDRNREGEAVGDEIRATLTALMPWGVSILAHVALIVLAFFLVWQTIVDEPGERVTVPELPIAPPVDSFANQPIEDPTQEQEAGGGLIVPIASEVEPVAIAPGFEMPAPPIVSEYIGNGIGPKIDDGKDDGGGKFGMETGSASDVVFIIDASGSMVDVLPFVINELNRVVTAMQPRQVNGRLIYTKATVLFFSGQGVFEVPGGGATKGLRPMTPAFKNAIREWVSLDNFRFDTGGRGTAYVDAAVTRALGYQPELVVLLSDNLTGGGQGATQHEIMQDDLLDLIHRHNRHLPPARFNTIQFLYEDPLVRAGLKGTLQRIADETGGKARFVPESELSRR